MSTYSWSSGLVKNKGWQSAIVLLTAVYWLTLNETAKPTRKRVLTFIRVKKLVDMQPVGKDEWAKNEHLWRQFFSWCREDLTLDGLLAYRPGETGCWELTEKGRRQVEIVISRCRERKQSADVLLTLFRENFHECIFTEKFLQLVLTFGASSVGPK